MLISICVPCHNRAYTLKVTLPHMINAANSCPPVEIAILNYNSPDDLEDYFYDIANVAYLADGNFLTYRKYTGRDYYHMAHARNLSVSLSSSEYVVLADCDVIFSEIYFERIRRHISNEVVWMMAKNSGYLVCKRDEFFEAGGYDERFEFYSPEDKDLIARLERRGKKFSYYANSLIVVIPTLREEKYKNYRINSRLEIKKIVNPIFKENQRKKTLIANEGCEWGSWK